MKREKRRVEKRRDKKRRGCDINFTQITSNLFGT
jgi:hypothetical protein